LTIGWSYVEGADPNLATNTPAIWAESADSAEAKQAPVGELQ